MKQLTTVLALVLATTNASSYFHPVYHFQQRSISDDNYNEGAEDREASNFLPKLTSLGGLQGWNSAPDPRMYVLTEIEPPLDVQQNELRVKRKGPSLSIVNPLDVLRQRLLIEMARRQKAESLGKIELNRAFLSNLGKRSINEDVLQSTPEERNDAHTEQSDKEDTNGTRENHILSRQDYWKSDLSPHV